MPIHGNAGVPDVTAAHGSVVRKRFTLAANGTDVLSLPTAGCGRVQVLLSYVSSSYPGSVLWSVVGTGNMPATFAALATSPFFYNLDNFVYLGNSVSAWTAGTYTPGLANYVSREYATFTPFVTVVGYNNASAAVSAVVDVTIMGMTG